jgi:excisionase family DNA binding protein
MAALEPLTYTVNEAAQIVGVSRAFAYELAARGDLPTIRLGRRVVIRRTSLEQWLADRESEQRVA